MYCLVTPLVLVINTTNNFIYCRPVFQSINMPPTDPLLTLHIPIPSYLNAGLTTHASHLIGEKSFIPSPWGHETVSAKCETLSSLPSLLPFLPFRFSPPPAVQRILKMIDLSNFHIQTWRSRNSSRPHANDLELLYRDVRGNRLKVG